MGIFIEAYRAVLAHELLEVECGAVDGGQLELLHLLPQTPPVQRRHVLQEVFLHMHKPSLICSLAEGCQTGKRFKSSHSNSLHGQLERLHLLLKALCSHSMHSMKKGFLHTHKLSLKCNPHFAMPAS